MSVWPAISGQPIQHEHWAVSNPAALLGWRHQAQAPSLPGSTNRGHSGISLCCSHAWEKCQDWPQGRMGACTAMRSRRVAMPWAAEQVRSVFCFCIVIVCLPTAPAHPPLCPNTGHYCLHGYTSFCGRTIEFINVFTHMCSLNRVGGTFTNLWLISCMRQTLNHSHNLVDCLEQLCKPHKTMPKTEYESCRVPLFVWFNAFVQMSQGPHTLCSSYHGLGITRQPLKILHTFL